MACLAASTPVFAPARAARGVRRASSSRRGGLVVVAGKKGAWAKEFDPEYEKSQEKKEVDQSMWPGLEKDTEVSTYNILVKKTGPLNITWNGVGVIQVPKGGKTDAESNNVAKTVLIQRKELILSEVDRLYPKMCKDKSGGVVPLDFVIQLFEDPYADPVDMTQQPPADLEPVPAEIKFLPKGKRYPY